MYKEVYAPAEANFETLILSPHFFFFFLSTLLIIKLSNLCSCTNPGSIDSLPLADTAKRWSRTRTSSRVSLRPTVTTHVIHADPLPFCSCLPQEPIEEPPDPGLKVDFEPSTDTTANSATEAYKPFQHSQQPQTKKRAAVAAVGKAARAKKAKAIERADKTNQKFVVNKAKAERKKLMKS